MSARIKTKELIPFCRRMSTSLDAGVDLRKCLQREVDNARGSRRHGLAEISQRVNGGESLSSAMQAAGDLFPRLVRDLVEVGEHAGKLDLAFAQLGEHYQRITKLRRAYLSAITGPAIQLALALTVVGLFILVMGMIGNGQDVLGFGMVGVVGLVKYVTVLGVTGMVLAFLVSGWSRGKLGAPYLLQSAMRVPYLGECIQAISLSRMAWTLSLVSNTAMDVKQGAALALRSSQNLHYTRHQDSIRQTIASGRRIHEALREVRAFPAEFVDTIEAGEEAGSLVSSLEYLSREYQSRAEAMSEILGKIAAFATWAVVAGIIIFFIFRIFSIYLGAIQGAIDGV